MVSYSKNRWGTYGVDEIETTSPLQPEPRVAFLKRELAEAEKAVAEEKAKVAAEKAAAERAAAEKAAERAAAAEAAKTPGRKFAEKFVVEGVSRSGREPCAVVGGLFCKHCYPEYDASSVVLALRDTLSERIDAFLAAHRPAFDEKLAREIAERMVPQSGQVITFNGGKVYLLHPGLEWDVRNYITYAIQEYARRAGK